MAMTSSPLPTLPLTIQLIKDPRIVATLERVYRDDYRVSVFYNNRTYGTLQQAFSAAFPIHARVANVLLNGWDLWQWEGKPLYAWRKQLLPDEDVCEPWITCFDSHINSDGVFLVEEYAQYVEYVAGEHSFYGSDGPIGHFMREYLERPNRNTKMDTRKDPTILKWYKYDPDRRGWWARIKTLPGPVFITVHQIRGNSDWVDRLVSFFLPPNTSD